MAHSVPSEDTTLLWFGNPNGGALDSVEVSASRACTEWSPDGRFISLLGDSGVSLVALRTPLEDEEVHDRPADSARSAAGRSLPQGGTRDFHRQP